MFRASVLSAIASAVCFVGTAHATVVFESDFESGAPAEVSGGAVETVSDASIAAMLGLDTSVYTNTSNSDGTATTVTLGGLAAHTGINVFFDLVLIDSWDGTTGTNAPDFFNVSVDDTVAFSEAANNFGDPLGPFAASFIGDGSVFGGGQQDVAFSVSLLDIAHTASTLTLALFGTGDGFIGFPDEYFAIDNLRIELVGAGDVAAVPLPGAAWFMLMGLGALVARCRR